MNKSIQLAALFMSLLVLMLPVAFAQKLDITRFSGEQNVEDVIRPAGDTLYISVLAEISGNPGEDVAKRRLRVIHNGEKEYFTGCTKSGELYDCTYESTDLISYGSEEYEIVLLDVDGNEIKSLKKVLFVDKMSPSILEFSVKPELSRTGDMQISYAVEDYGRKIGDTAACTGLKDISITAGSTTLDEIEFANKKVCDDEKDSLNYQYSTSDNFVELDVCIVARDYLDQASDVECRIFKIDNAPPDIKSVEFRDVKGYEVSHIRTGQKVLVDVFVTIEEQGGIVLDSVKADLSKLNPDLGERKADYVSDNIYVWQDVAVTTPKTCEITVKAEDEIGNEAAKTLSCILPVDDTGPAVVSVYAGAASLNGTPLVGDNGTIFVDFKEDGAGMDKADAFLDLHSLGLDSVAKAGKCKDNGGGSWTCEWTVSPAVGTGSYKITVLDATKDDLGNNAVQASEYVLVDTTPPEINSVDITFIHETADYGPLAVYGDTIEFDFDVTGAEEAYVNLSDVGGGYDPAVECTPASCRFSVLIDVSGPLNATLDFDFYDIAKNHESYKYSFDIYGVMMNDTETNYWSSKVICSPKMIDRSTAELYNHPVYCQVKLTANNPDAEPVYVVPGDLGECVGDFGGYVVDVEAINNNFGSKNPYLVFTLAATPFEINELKFTCPVYVSTRVGDYFSPVLEIENATVEMEFYDLPYGEVYSNYENRIRDTMDDAVNLMDWIGQVEYWVNFARKVCNIKTTYTSILAGLDAVISLLVVTGAAIGTIWDKDAGETFLEQAQILCNQAVGPLEKMFGGDPTEKKKTVDFDKKPVQSFFNVADFLCKMANCQLSRDEAKKYDDDLTIVASAFGGGISDGACKKYKEFVGGALLVDYDKLTAGQETGSVDTPVDIKESIVGSLACLCLPGIVYNLNKMRQIYCGYAYCLGQRVLEEGVPKSYCDSEKAYLTCNYVVGQVFEVIPFNNLAQRYINIIQDTYANPISAVTALSALICGGNKGKGGLTDYCKSTGNFDGDVLKMLAYGACTVSKTVAKVGDAVASIALVEQDWRGGVSDDYCEEAKDLLK